MIYFDHNATTPMAEEVLEAMQPWLSQHYGNPSSVHRAGRLARQAIDTAREQVAALLGAQPGEIVFTSGGTEADNLAFSAVASGAGQQQARYVVASTEHAAVLEAAQARAAAGAQVDILPVDGEGRISEDSLARVLAEGASNSTLVSIMWANNETGVIQDIAALGGVARAHGARMHTDAVQAAGKLALDFAATPVDLLSLSAHKIYGPKGVGALLCKRDVELRPLLFGGGHEHHLRAGTENLPGIVGFGQAAVLARRDLNARQQHTLALREHLEQGLTSLPNVQIFAREAARVSNTCQFGVHGFHSEALLMELDRRDIAVTSGSACHAGTGQPTHVLLAMGYDEDTAHSAIRVSLGVRNTHDEVDVFLKALNEIVGTRAPAFAAGLFGG